MSLLATQRFGEFLKFFVNTTVISIRKCGKEKKYSVGVFRVSFRHCLPICSVLK